jgi:hypothetical protein
MHHGLHLDVASRAWGTLRDELNQFPRKVGNGKVHMFVLALKPQHERLQQLNFGNGIAYRSYKILLEMFVWHSI